MKRQAAETQARVYAYGVLAPDSGMEPLEDEAERQHDLWDALVRVDREAEAATLTAARNDPDIDAMMADIAAASEKIGIAVKARKAARAKSRSKVDTPELDAEIKALADTRRALRAKLWPRINTWRKLNKPTVDAIETARREAESAATKEAGGPGVAGKALKKRIAELRKQPASSERDAQIEDLSEQLAAIPNGLYWCNAGRVHKAFQDQRIAVRKRGKRLNPRDRSRRDGIIVVSIPRCNGGLGASWADIQAGRFGALKITPVTLDQATRAERRRDGRAILNMRIDAAGNTLTANIIIHRLPPADARIKEARLTWRPEGAHLRWQLELVCSYPRAAIAHPSPAAVGIDLGWRMQKDRSLLVATAYDGTNIDRLTLPASWMAGMDQLERLQQHLDDNALALARSWHERVADLPDDLRAPLMAWRPRLGSGHVNVVALHDACRARITEAERKKCGRRADIPEDIRHWYDRYRHLSVWRDHLRANLQRQRREIYRLWARRIGIGYMQIAIEEFDLSEVALVDGREPDQPENPLPMPARALRQRACVHELRKEIEDQAGKRGAVCERIEQRRQPKKRGGKAVASTVTCHQCGGHNAPEDRARLVWTCEHCGVEWDQDVNAAINLYRAVTGAETAARAA